MSSRPDKQRRDNYEDRYSRDNVAGRFPDSLRFGEPERSRWILLLEAAMANRDGSAGPEPSASRRLRTLIANIRKCFSRGGVNASIQCCDERKYFRTLPFQT